MYPGLECFDSLLANKLIRVRQKVPVMLRKKVWNMYYTTETGECPFCKGIITLTDCHMAHDLSHKKEGEINVDNLYPCCSSCNLSMGQMSYEEVMKKLRGC
jgi:5-methylcytosine-specific restriction endonuclease McrA